MVNVILELRPPHFEFFDFLVGGEIDLFFDAVNFIVQAMIFIEHFPEVIIRAFQSPDDFSMFREFPENGMMEVHGSDVVFQFWNVVLVLKEPGAQRQKTRELAASNGLISRR